MSEELVFTPLQVIVQDGNFEKALKLFRNMVQREKILSMYKKRQSFEKPSDKKRRKKAEQLKKIRDAQIRAAKIANGEFEKELAKRKWKKEAKLREKYLKNTESHE